MPDSSGPIRIAIIGAGIGGLTLSPALAVMDQEQKFEVKIYESAKQLSAIGAGIFFLPRSMEIMKAFGLEDRLSKIVDLDHLSKCGTSLQIRKGDQQEGMYVSDVAESANSIHLLRSELQHTLTSHLTHELHLSHRLVSYEELEDEVLLHFENGKTASCDFVVGADGVKSCVRRCFLEKQGLSTSPSMYPIWIGDYAYRGIISGELLESEFPGHRVCNTPMLYIGKNKLLVAYRVCHPANLISIAAIVSNPSGEGIVFEGPTSVECSQDEVLSVFKGWEPEVLALLKCLHHPIRWAVQATLPMDCNASGRIALVGDSAHAMPPYQASGAAQAVEDNYILASLLTSPHCTKRTLPKVSKVYDAIRRVPANEMVDLSRTSGKLHQFRGPGFEDVVEGQTDVQLEKLFALVEIVGKRSEALLKESLEDCRRRALQMLADSMGDSLV